VQILSDYVYLIIVVVIALIPITNPFSSAPIFLSITSKLDEGSRNKLLKLTCIYMFSILIVFLLAGVVILNFFGISLDSLRIAGGLIITFLGFKMLFPASASDTEQTEVNTYEQARGLAFTPLAMPMLSGPGSIAVVVSMAADISKDQSIIARIAGYLAEGLGILITVLICWLVLRSSTKITTLLGTSGLDALTKIMGFVIICIGVEFTVSGIKGFF